MMEWLQVLSLFLGIAAIVVGAFLWIRTESRTDQRDLNAKLDKISDKLNDLDKRLYTIEMMMHMKDCCVLKQDQNLKKAE